MGFLQALDVIKLWSHSFTGTQAAGHTHTAGYRTHTAIFPEYSDHPAPQAFRCLVADAGGCGEWPSIPSWGSEKGISKVAASEKISFGSYLPVPAAGL